MPNRPHPINTQTPSPIRSRAGTPYNKGTTSSAKQEKNESDDSLLERGVNYVYSYFASNNVDKNVPLIAAIKQPLKEHLLTKPEQKFELIKIILGAQNSSELLDLIYSDLESWTPIIDRCSELEKLSLEDKLIQFSADFLNCFQILDTHKNPLSDLYSGIIHAHSFEQALEDLGFKKNSLSFYKLFTQKLPPHQLQEEVMNAISGDSYLDLSFALIGFEFDGISCLPPLKGANLSKASIKNLKSASHLKFDACNLTEFKIIDSTAISIEMDTCLCDNLCISKSEFNSINLIKCSSTTELNFHSLAVVRFDIEPHSEFNILKVTDSDMLHIKLHPDTKIETVLITSSSFLSGRFAGKIADFKASNCTYNPEKISFENTGLSSEQINAAFPTRAKSISSISPTIESNLYSSGSETSSLS